jgi:hypothetical protein
MKNRILMVILPVLACFALLSGAQAISPAPDGCYPNFTTAEGCNALNFLTTGAGNTGLGWFALSSTSTGSFNTGVGGGALALNNGDSNTAVGAAALLSNSTGSNNTAVGTDALVNNTVDDNTAIGFFALGANTTGGTLETSVLGYPLGPNTAVGSQALESNVNASANTAVGYNALHSQVTGITLDGDPHLAANTAVGFEALANVTGSAAGDNAANDAYGYQALFNLTDGDSNVAVGFEAGAGLTSGTDNIYLGAFSGAPVASEHGVIRIGSLLSSSCFIKGISGVTGANFTDVVSFDPLTGQLGDFSSSAQYKKDINPMDKTSEAIFSLRPVTFHYKNDKTNTPQFGLIAEEVAKVNPALIGVDKEGKPHSVQYMKVDAMLLNEFLKEHKKVEEQQASISQLKSEMQTMVAQLNEQAAQIQKVSAQVELSKSAPQTVLNNQ